MSSNTDQNQVQAMDTNENMVETVGETNSLNETVGETNSLNETVGETNGLNETAGETNGLNETAGETASKPTTFSDSKVETINVPGSPVFSIGKKSETKEKKKKHKKNIKEKTPCGKNGCHHPAKKSCHGFCGLHNPKKPKKVIIHCSVLNCAIAVKKGNTKCFKHLNEATAALNEATAAADTTKDSMETDGAKEPAKQGQGALKKNNWKPAWLSEDSDDSSSSSSSSSDNDVTFVKSKPAPKPTPTTKPTPAKPTPTEATPAKPTPTEATSSKPASNQTTVNEYLEKAKLKIELRQKFVSLMILYQETTSKHNDVLSEEQHAAFMQLFQTMH